MLVFAVMMGRSNPSDAEIKDAGYRCDGRWNGSDKDGDWGEMAEEWQMTFSMNKRRERVGGRNRSEEGWKGRRDGVSNDECCNQIWE